ncbi:hypothetical protein DV736_g1670, partial [Chaetothyriales sp. CBS 134916]
MGYVDEAFVITSIVGVAGAGFRLSLILNAVSCEVANDGLGVHSIAKTVTLFSLTLKQAATVFQAWDSVHSWNALDGVRTIADNTTCILDEFNDMLDRVQAKPTDGSAIPSIQQRFEWCFKTHRVQYLLAQLDAHKLSLSLILKVLQLGKLMASTWRNDPHIEAQAHHDLLNQERLETQNVLIVRYWQMSKLSRLYEASRREDNSDKVTVCKDHKDDPRPISHPSSSHLTIEAAPLEYATAVALAELPNYSLGELDQTLNKIKQSPRDMVRVSSEAIGPLLDRWTRWEEVQQRRQWRDSGGHNAPSVDQLNEDEDDRQYYERYREREDSPKGVYLEGTTTDWRRPHSVAAMEEAKRRRQKYKGYQPSAHAESSDADDSPDSRRSKKKKTPRHHVIESASDSSTPEDEPRNKGPQVRRSSAGDRRKKYAERPPTIHSVSATQAMPRQGSTLGIPVSSHRTQLGPSLHPGANMSYHTPDRRDLEAMQRSNSAPIQPIHLANGPHSYHQSQQPYPAAPPNAGPVYPHAPVHSPYSIAQARYTPQPPPYTRMAVSPRAASQDAKGGRYSPHSASLLGTYSSSPYLSSASALRPGHARSLAEERKQGTKQNLREGATKGLLGAGAIAGFLEALEALNL